MRSWDGPFSGMLLVEQSTISIIILSGKLFTHYVILLFLTPLTPCIIILWWFLLRTSVCDVPA